MALLIAILWYLQLLSPNTTYAINDINVIASQNQTAVQTIQNSRELSTQATQQFQTDMNNDYKKINEEWTDDPQPILN